MLTTAEKVRSGEGSGEIKRGMRTQYNPNKMKNANAAQNVKS